MSDAPSDAPIQPGTGPEPPAKTPAVEPEVSMEKVTNAKFSGVRGNCGTNNILQSDGDGGSCVLVQALKGDVILEAKANFQSECAKRRENVTVDNNLWTENYEMSCKTTYRTFVDGDSSHYANSNYLLKVVGTHKQEVGPQVVIAQSQQIDVAGDQIENVYGNQTMKVGTNRVVHITGTEKRTVDGNCDWFKYGNNFSMFVGFEESIKLANSIGVTIGAKEEANLAMSLTLNASGAAEQTFAMKRSDSYGIVKENTYGVKSGTNYAINNTKDMVADIQGDLVQESIDCKIASSKLYKLASKLSLLA